MTFVALPNGETHQSRPIEAFKTPPEAEAYTYLIAGTHGDEVEGVYVLHRLFEWLKEQGTAYPLVVVPVLNVDGLAVGSRVNANGVDLNRNLPSSCWEKGARAGRYHPGESPLSELENQFLSELMHTWHPKQIITFHSWKPMLQYDSQELEAIAQLLSEHNGYPLVPTDIENHPTPGSLGNWAPEAFGCPVLTVECPEINHDHSLEKIWEVNAKAFSALFQSHLL